MIAKKKRGRKLSMKKWKHKSPRYSDLFKDVIDVIANSGGSASIDEILSGVIARRKFPDAVID